MLVLDRRDVRHLRRPGGVLNSALCPVRGPTGGDASVRDGRVVTDGGASIEPLDPDTFQLPEPYELAAPIQAPEVWCAGVTYERSRDARVEESAAKDVYTMVYDAPRRALHEGRRHASHGRPGPVRSGFATTRPGTCRSRRSASSSESTAAIAGLTIGNDVSSRDIEGANPLYLPQAKVYAGACAIGRRCTWPRAGARVHLTLRVTDEWAAHRVRGRDVHRADAPVVRRARRVAADDNPVPPGSVLLTGTVSSRPTASRCCPVTSSRSTSPRSARSSTRRARLRADRRGAVP